MASDFAAQLQVSQIVVVIVTMLAVGEITWLVTNSSSPGHLLRDVASSAGSGLGALVLGAPMAIVFYAGYGFVSRFAFPALSEFWSAHPVASVFSAFVAWDLAGYVYHRIGHQTRWGWAGHRPHHTGRHFNLALAWRQSWLPVHSVVLPLVALGGWPVTVVLGCAAVSSLIQGLQHTAVPVSAPAWLEWVFMTGRLHRRHHLRSNAGSDAARDGVFSGVNLGPVLTVWDRLGGTFDPLPPPESADYGMVGPSSGVVACQFDGWRDLWSDYRARSRA